MSMQGMGHVAAVLEQLLTDFGRRAADDPRRLKGLLTDTLGAEASAHHDAIEAVVAAAAAGVPQAALGDADDRSGLADMARPHLADPDTAEEVVEIWISALRVQDRIPTDGPTVASPVSRTIAAGEPTQLPTASDDPTLAMSMADAAVASATATTGPGFMARVSAYTSERKIVVLSAAGVLVLALGGVGAASMWTGDVTTTTTTTVAAATTTMAEDTTTTVEPLAAIDHEEYVTSWGATVNRHWEISGDRLTKKVTVASGEEAIGGTVWEVFPEKWGIDASTLIFNTSDLLTAVHSNETVVRLVFAFPANSSWSYEYSVPLPSGGEDDPRFLETLLAEWELALTEFLATPPPSLEITSDKPVGDQVTFRGSTTPGAEVQVDGAIIEVAEDGTFEHTAVLAPGENLVVVRAVDHVRGQATIEELKWTYTPPTTTSTTTATTSPSTTPTTSPTTTPTTAPANQAPTATCGTQNTYMPGVFSSYWLNFPYSCFSDSDGTVVEAFATQPSDGFGSITKGATSCTGSVWCWTYWPPETWDEAARWVVIHVRVQDDDGAYSPYVQWNLCINCSAP